jgi:hypothetical protein
MGRVHNHNRPGAGGRRVKLAPGFVLTSEGESPTGALVLLDGKVHLNEHALAILSLCDGSRTRDRVVVDAMIQTSGGMRAADIVGFLDAAHARGWVVDTD